MNFDLSKILVNVLLGALGFFFVATYNNVATGLSEINKVVIGIKLELTEMNAKMMTEDKVREIVQYELMQYGLTKKQ